MKQTTGEEQLDWPAHLSSSVQMLETRSHPMCGLHVPSSSHRRHIASCNRHYICRTISVGVGERRLAPAQSTGAERNSGACTTWRSGASPFPFQGAAVLLRSGGSSGVRGRRFAARAKCSSGAGNTAGRAASIHERVAECSYVPGHLMSTRAQRSYEGLRACAVARCGGFMKATAVAPTSATTAKTVSKGRVLPSTCSNSAPKTGPAAVAPVRTPLTSPFSVPND